MKSDDGGEWWPTPPCDETPTYALLQTTEPSRLARWEDFSKHAKAVSIQTLESQTATDAAGRLAVAAPTAQADFALAVKFQPILLFDAGESVPLPLSVSALFEEDRVRLCHDEGTTETDCGSGPIEHSSELKNGGTHLRLEQRNSRELRRLAADELANAEILRRIRAEPQRTAKPEPGAAPVGTPPPGTAEVESPDRAEAPSLAAPKAVETPSAIYVHPSPILLHGREMLYLDYWWYLPDNPVSLGDGALCGAGLVIAGVTCQSHQSDWEGITVVVDRGGAKAKIVAVQYAQHNSVVRYGWKALRRRWRKNAIVEEKTAGMADIALRPLAFVARGTHASYPLPCVAGCSQVTAKDVGDGPHDGSLPWIGDYSGACGESSCLQMLPTRLGGSEPALWSAFEGTWGDVHCFLTYYCDSGKPPTAPGQQRRYEHPAHYSGVVDAYGRYQPLPSEG